METKDSYKDKYMAFLEATEAFVEIEDLIEKDITESHQMGLYLNTVIADLQEEVHDLRGFKKSVKELIKSFSGSLFQHLVTVLAENEENTHED